MAKSNYAAHLVLLLQPPHANQHALCIWLRPPNLSYLHSMLFVQVFFSSFASFLQSSPLHPLKLISLRRSASESGLLLHSLSFQSVAWYSVHTPYLAVVVSSLVHTSPYLVTSHVHVPSKTHVHIVLAMPQLGAVIPNPVESSGSHLSDLAALRPANRNPSLPLAWPLPCLRLGKPCGGRRAHACLLRPLFPVQRTNHLSLLELQPRSSLLCCSSCSSSCNLNAHPVLLWRFGFPLSQSF